MILALNECFRDGNALKEKQAKKAPGAAGATGTGTGDSNKAKK